MRLEWQLPCGFWVLNPGPPEEQPVLLTSESYGQDPLLLLFEDTDLVPTQGRVPVVSAACTSRVLSFPGSALILGKEHFPFAKVTSPV